MVLQSKQAQAKVYDMLLICACQMNGKREVAEGQFRVDKYALLYNNNIDSLIIK